VSALPLHPAVNHFPVVASLLASGCVLLGACRPLPERREWLLRALLLLVVAAAALPLVLGSGRAWSAAQGLWPPGQALPPRRALNGLLRWHVLGAALATLLTLSGLGLALAWRRGRSALWPVLLVVLAAALATGATARLGGQMAFGETEPAAGP
jgi:uncharacterized membrane protein